MNYPKGVKTASANKIIHYENRGMSLESDINLSNQFYIDNDIAYIYKKPTPIKITKVDFPNRKGAVIKEAFFSEPSTTDYNGLYQGKYIDFEAKETTSKTSFPLNNIHLHQILHIRNMVRHDGIAFLIVRFTVLNKTFLLLGEDFIAFLDAFDRKSIPLCYFEEKGYLLKDKYMPRIDYIEIINMLYGGNKHE